MAAGCLTNLFPKLTDYEVLHPACGPGGVVSALCVLSQLVPFVFYALPSKKIICIYMCVYTYFIIYITHIIHKTFF